MSQVGVLRGMRLYGFSLGEFLGSSDLGDQSIILIHQGRRLSSTGYEPGVAHPSPRSHCGPSSIVNPPLGRSLAALHPNRINPTTFATCGTLLASTASFQPLRHS